MSDIGVYFRAKKAQLEKLQDLGFSLNAQPFLERQWAATVPGTTPTEDGLRQLAGSYSISTINEEPLLWLSRTKMNSYYTNNGTIPFTPSSLNQLYVKINEADEVEAYWVYYDNTPESKSFDAAAMRGSGGFHPQLEALQQRIGQWLKTVLIVIRAHGLTPGDKGTSALLQQITDCKIIVYKVEELAINPTKHIYAPEVYKLTTKEKEEHLRGKARSQLPTFRYNTFKNMKNVPDAKSFHDPVVKYYDYQPTDLIRIKREVFYAPTIVHEEISYRSVQQA